MGMRTTKNLAILASLALLLAFGFQNCAKTSFSSSGDAPAIAIPAIVASSGNGHPYEGKPYREMNEGGVACADGLDYRAEILFKSPEKARLVRENCKPVTPVDLAAGSFQLDAVHSDVLYYDKRRFIAEGSACAPSGSQTFTASGTFRVPACVTSVKVTAVGGAGGFTTSSLCPAPNWGNGGDGGAGIATVTALAAGTDVPVTVGSQGSFTPCIAFGACTGGAGGPTAFGAIVVAGGGAGGQTNNMTCVHGDGARGGFTSSAMPSSAEPSLNAALGYGTISANASGLLKIEW